MNKRERKQFLPIVPTVSFPFRKLIVPIYIDEFTGARRLTEGPSGANPLVEKAIAIYFTGNVRIGQRVPGWETGVNLAYLVNV